MQCKLVVCWAISQTFAGVHVRSSRGLREGRRFEEKNSKVARALTNKRDSTVKAGCCAFAKKSWVSTLDAVAGVGRMIELAADRLGRNMARKGKEK